jgi:hypothetical protein
MPSAPDRPALLQPAPAALVQGGALAFGAWAGAVKEASLDLLGPGYAGGLSRRLREKRWIYLLASTPEAFVCLAVVDLGYLHSGFCGVFDRLERRLLFDANPILPPVCGRVSDDAAGGPFARLVGPGVEASFVRDAAAVRVRARFGDCSVDLALDPSTALPPLSVCAEIAPGRFDFTQKTPWLTARGEVRAGGKTFPFDGAAAGLDFTHGHLARRTEWRWAFGMGRCAGQPIALNCSEGFLGAGGAENVVWVGGAPAALGPVRFSFDPKDPAARWHLSGGGLELEFTPEGARSQDTDVLGLITSRYLQPFGNFRGHLTTTAGERLEIELDGVTEDHTAVW